MKFTYLILLFISTSAWATKYFDNVVVSGVQSVGTLSAPDTSAALDIVSTSKGVLFPRMTTAQRNAISSPVDGLVVYNTDTKLLESYSASAVAYVSYSVSTQTASFPAQTQNKVLAAPVASTGSPLFRLLLAADLPNLQALNGLLDLSLQVTSSLPLTNLVPVTASRALVSNASGIVSVSAVTATELSYVGGASSNLQAQINAITTASVGITQLTGDVTTGTGGGSQAATVASVGGSSAANVNTATTLIVGNKTANTVLAGPTGGGAAAATFRALVAADIPLLTLGTNVVGSISTASVTGTMPVAQGGTNKTSWVDGIVKVASNSFSTVSYPLALNTDVSTPITTKGDILVYSGSTFNRLAVGTNGFVLTASSAATNGVAWAAASGSASSNWYVDAVMFGTAAQAQLSAGAITSWTTLDKNDLNLYNASWPGATAAQIACTNGVAPSGTNCGASSENIGISLTAPDTQEVEVCASFVHYMDIVTGSGVQANISATFAIIETPSSATTVTNISQDRQQSAFDLTENTLTRQDMSIPHRLCGRFPGLAGVRTFRLAYKKAADVGANNDAILTFLGTDLGDQGISWTVHNWK